MKTSVQPNPLMFSDCQALVRESHVPIVFFHSTVCAENRRLRSRQTSLQGKKLQLQLATGEITFRSAQETASSKWIVQGVYGIPHSTLLKLCTARESFTRF